MNAKRKPKPVKAWAYVNRHAKIVDVRSDANRDQLRDPYYRINEDRPAINWRIARVEIREVGR